MGLRFVRLLAVLSLLGTMACIHAPRFIDTSGEDRTYRWGRTLACAASDASADEALRAAEGQCDAKICAVCGRDSFELCSVVRRGELNVKRKELVCQDGGCVARVTAVYTNTDADVECPSYKDGRLTDAAACKADLDAFAGVRGVTSSSMIERHRTLRRALIHCANIDAQSKQLTDDLDRALVTGLNTFEHAKERREYLTTYAPLRTQLNDAKRFTERVRLVIPYITNKQYVLAVLEAAQAPDVTSDEHMRDLLDLFSIVPQGAAYGAPNVHFDVYEQLLARPSMTEAALQPVTDLMDDLYPKPADWTDFNRRRRPKPAHVPHAH